MEEQNQTPQEQNHSSNEDVIKIPVLDIIVPKKTLLVGCFIGIIAIIILIIALNANHEHEFGEWLTVDEATCTSNGFEEKSCKCGEKITRTVSAIGHIEIIDPKIEATCTKSGLTRGTHCANCSIVLVPQQETAPIDHISGDWIIDKPATHTKDGSRHTKCIMCNKTLVQETLLSGQNKMEYTLLDDGTYEISGIGQCDDREIFIPSKYNGLSVTKIAYKAFERCQSFISVSIPDSIKIIEERAFEKCKYLETVVIGNAVTSIGKGAFYDCDSLVNVTIPNSVTTIEESAFESCNSLKNIVIPNSVTTIGESLFAWCTSLENVTLPNTIRSINAYMFYCCDSLKSFRIPDDVTSIDRCAFTSCDSLTTVTIPKSVISIGELAFSRIDGLTSITYLGTKQQWNDIEKVEDRFDFIDGILDWDYNSGDYTIYCTDGTI